MLKPGFFLPIIAALLLSGGSAFAASPRTEAQRRVNDIFSREPFTTGVTSCLAVRMNGDTLVSINRLQRMVPASNMKLITTGVALKVLGPDFRFETRLGYTGEIQDSVLVGNLYILGGGDPTTGSRTPCACSSSETFGRWARIIREAGIRRIDGLVVGDPRYFTDPTSEGLGSSYEDIGFGYGIGPTGLNFFQNMQFFLVNPGVAVGQRAYVQPRYPDTPWMTFRNGTVTGAPRTANTLYYIPDEFDPRAEVRGQFPIDRRGYQLECSNMFGAYTCAYQFHQYLSKAGIKTGGYADIDSRGAIRTDLADGGKTCGQAAPWAGITVIGSCKSPALRSIIDDTNYTSDNFYAETLFRQIGRRSFGTTLQDSCCVAVSEVLRSMGLPVKHNCDIFDGSGLSRKNYVSADFFVRFLRAMAKSDVFDPYYHSLPRPGMHKTSLENRFHKAPRELTERIHMKSGSMNGVRCFSGYIDSPDGDPAHMVVFSVMTNNVTESSFRVYPLIDDIISAVAAEN